MAGVARLDNLGLMAAAHVVWDWNGTLLDDLEIVLEALNVGLAGFGLEPVGGDQYRDHFQRPVRSFYSSLFGREITDMEWQVLNKTFHDEYFSRVHRALLAEDALQALDRAEEFGWNQSLLSMTIHDRLVQIVESHGISERFALIDGLSGETGGLKTTHLRHHLEQLGVEAAETLVIGDTPDDAVAARNVGARVALYDGGSHHRHTLDAVGAPVAHTLVEAVEIGL